MTTMIQRKTLVLAALALCVASCGGAGGASCSVSFSGSFSGTYACTATASYNSSNNTGVVALLTNTTGALKYYAFGMNLSADLHTGTYAPDPSNLSSTILSLTNGQSFAETSVQSSAGTGTFSLKVTGLDTAGTTSGNKVYFIHGTLDETLAAQAGGATGNVTVHASF